METQLYKKVDLIISEIDKFVEPKFFEEKIHRENRTILLQMTDNELMKVVANLIAFSHAKSNVVSSLIKSGKLDEVLVNYNVDKISKMNHNDIIDKYWENIKGIIYKRKVSAIITIARKLKMENLSEILLNPELPKSITTFSDIDNFWEGFHNLKNILINNKVPYLRATTTLLHFLLDIGYDCVKPDVIIMKVATRIGIVEKNTGDNNLINTVKFLQKYSIYKGLRPSIVDLYFLISGGQENAKQYVKKYYYEEHKF